jgi:hypothetical protein
MARWTCDCASLGQYIDTEYMPCSEFQALWRSITRVKTANLAELPEYDGFESPPYSSPRLSRRCANRNPLQTINLNIGTLPSNG